MPLVTLYSVQTDSPEGDIPWCLLREGVRVNLPPIGLTENKDSQSWFDPDSSRWQGSLMQHAFQSEAEHGGGRERVGIASVRSKVTVTSIGEFDMDEGKIALVRQITHKAIGDWLRLPKLGHFLTKSEKVYIFPIPCEWLAQRRRNRSMTAIEDVRSLLQVVEATLHCCGNKLHHLGTLHSSDPGCSLHNQFGHGDPTQRFENVTRTHEEGSNSRIGCPHGFCLSPKATSLLTISSQHDALASREEERGEKEVKVDAMLECHVWHFQFQVGRRGWVDTGKRVKLQAASISASPLCQQHTRRLPPMVPLLRRFCQSLRHHLFASTLPLQLRSTVGLTPEVVALATTTTAAGERFNLEVLEAVGDSVLKLAVTCQILSSDSNTTSSLEMFTRFRSETLSNRNLERLCKWSGLWRLIATRRFTPNWAPSVKSNNGESPLKRKLTEHTCQSKRVRSNNNESVPNGSEGLAQSVTNNEGLQAATPAGTSTTLLEDVGGNGRGKDYADVFEALCGAVFLTSDKKDIRLIQQLLVHSSGANSASDVLVTPADPWVRWTHANPGDITKGREEEISSLWAKLQSLPYGYSFHHRSAVGDVLLHHPQATHRFAKLRLLGDAVIELASTLVLMEHCRGPGELTVARQHLCNRRSREHMATSLGLTRLCPQDQRARSPHQTPRIGLCEVFDALCGATFLDGGCDWPSTYAVISSVVKRFRLTHALQTLAASPP